tara:strand:- start:632 stop:1234 length:603 start_codon:yes stop_codon:yes gene_type:complete
MGVISNGTTLLDAGALDSDIPTGDMILLSTATASSSATLDFTSGINSTYKEYIFKYTDIHPQTDTANFSFQADTGTNTNYNQNVTSTFFQAIHAEGDGSEEVTYNTGNELGQANGFQIIAETANADADGCIAGFLHLYEPSNTSKVKHFNTNSEYNQASNLCMNVFAAGYFNTATAITRVRFKMSSGNIDAGTIKMYGIK